MSNAIDAVRNEDDPMESIGAYVRYLRDAVSRILEDDEEGKPLLNHATSDECATLFQLAASIESTIALNTAQLRKNDEIARRKAAEDEDGPSLQ